MFLGHTFFSKLLGNKGIDFVISFLVFCRKKCYDRSYQYINKFKKIIKEGDLLGKFNL